MTRITQELRRLDQRELSVEEEFEQLQSRMAEVHSRLIRLRKQKRFLHEKGVEMVNRGLKDMDELEADEQREEEQRQADLRKVQEEEALLSLDMGQDVIDWGTVLLAGPGSADGTVEGVGGSSSGA